ncbi:GxxExxY protein [Dysgonomonas hofstadii]|uniref:GxxExxY protein n=1 Tax=Dysgonomonas hofstadii TaxID=637886 RepID=A0A840CRZ2_9BACT|nr:GxxExxY protein [Dysgonomonas hofstadii]MBB4037811.1 GxxExxY protein [Dysgonomonas hofstadii]
MDIKELIKSVINVSSKVHKELGSGLYINIYRECIVNDLKEEGLSVEESKEMPLMYRKLRFNKAYKVDMIIESTLVVGIRPMNIPEEIYWEYIHTYAKHNNSSVGLILDFNVKDFSTGIRIVQRMSPKPVVFPSSYMKYYYGKK